MSRLTDMLWGNGLYGISQIAHKTCRFQVSGMEHFRAAHATGRPVLYTTWHGMTMMLVGFYTDNDDVSRMVLLMPDDWRGASLEIFARKFGANPFIMNLKGDESMGTARRLTELVRKVKEGFNLYITPDGPDGPGYFAKPGVAYIAKKANALILPMAAYNRHGYVVNRWDRYVVPFPFSRIAIHIGEPISVPKETKDLDAVSDKLTGVLNAVTLQAAADYYEKAR